MGEDAFSHRDAKIENSGEGPTGDRWRSLVVIVDIDLLYVPPVPLPTIHRFLLPLYILQEYS